MRAHPTLTRLLPELCHITYAEATIAIVNPSHQTSPTRPLQPHLHSHTDPSWPGLTLPAAPVRFTLVQVPVTGTNRAEGRGRARANDAS